jgi:hypothetical protein
MKITFYCSIIFSFLLLQSCGGGGGGSSPAPAKSSTIAAVSSVAASSSSVASSFAPSSWSSSIPADYPIGVAEALPALNIKTENLMPINSKENYLNGEFTLTDANGEKVEGTLEIRGRGNSTWDWLKKPYRLKLTSSTEMLGMPASRHWVLLANYADKTLIRNDLAFMFSRHSGMEYTVRNHHVELTLNGSYRGVYQLAEHIRVAKDRVNIPETKVADTDDEKITGGYLLEVDFRMHKNYCAGASWDPVCVNGVNTARETTFCVDSSYGMNPFCVDTPETLLEPAWSAQRNYIHKYITDAEAALFGNDFTDPQMGYAAYIDVDTAINYYLINELFKNPDGAVASFYLYKKRNGKIFFGPVWDFDLAMGNAGYDDVDKTYGWHLRSSPWFARLFQDPAFKAKVAQRWNQLKAEGKLDYVFQYAEARTNWLSKVQEKNYTIWSVTDFAPWILHGSHGGTGSFEAESKELVRWQQARYQWMDSQFNP